MARLSVGNGLDEYLQKLGNLEMNAEEQCKKAVYKGADVVADAVKASIDTIPTRTGRRKRGVYDDQRAGLKEGMGIAKFQNDNGYLNVKVGFDGYNSHKTKSFPNGQPNAMIARSMERGTSFSPKTPFINKAVNKVKAQAEAVMQKTLDEEIKISMS